MAAWPLAVNALAPATTSAAEAPEWPATFALRRSRVTFTDDRFSQTKDPCPVFDGVDWHLFGSGWRNGVRQCQIVHGRAPRLEGPYALSDGAVDVGPAGSGVAAPGVIFDGAAFHMFLQTEFDRSGGTIEYLASADGVGFERRCIALSSDRSRGEACIYDAQPAVIDGRRFLVYAAASRVGQTEIHLAESTSESWAGPWRRHGPILTQRTVPFHNQVGSSGYEWGLEGPQLSQLPGGGVLMTAVCFLAGRRRGTRQRVFFAVAPSPTGPYRVMGVPLPPIAGEWDGGENGHAGAVIGADSLTLLYQGRNSVDGAWGYGLAEFALAAFDVQPRVS
jgi:hypothetical protein